ncbi:hypothetical protein PY092_12590 [Muricauda sp. 334s03]|uniref:Uncharacterized protein n=1 Tax=Flagellimonas yonaguniensis TaxID=3031325 RepID=A0ABT5Y0L8_9FLAO|nr:hypothetical protein [[Muricauda] yonaguniensis]MDF0716992.1 hypothetical protein [[Muricauda] yonaguniensis]
MSRYKEILIKNYFISRGWNLKREGNLFVYFSPPENIGLPQDYLLELPKMSANEKGFDNYIERLIEDLIFALPSESNKEDLKILFSKENSILKYKIFDADSSDGTISFQKHIDSLDNFKKALSQAVIFTATNKPIFGDAKYEVESYLNRCRALQTEKGSYVTRLEIPNDTIYTAFSKIESEDINHKLFDTLEYIEENIFNAKSKMDITENYLQDISPILNYELFNSIKNIYTKSHINNLEYQLSSHNQIRRIETERVQKSIPYFTKYLRDVKKLLLDVVPLEAIGYIKKLSSLAPLHSTRNEVTIDAEISGNTETIKIILRSDEYIEAIEAHKNEWPIRIKGKAQQNKTMLTIKEIEEFAIIKK